MKKISSSLTKFYKTGLKIIICMYLVISLIIYFIYNPAVYFLFFTILIFTIFFSVWFIFSKNLKEVFLDGSTLIVNDRRISFEHIVSIQKRLLSNSYKVRYIENNKIKSFLFLPTFSFPFFKQDFIKEIENYVLKKDIVNTKKLKTDR